MAWEPTKTMNGGGTPRGPPRGIGSSSATRLTPSYEIGDEINRKLVECLEKKYGGLRAHVAATKIQRAFRIYQLQKQFKSALNRDFGYQNGTLARPDDLRSVNSLQPNSRYQPINSLRTQLYVARTSHANAVSPRKNSTPCVESVSSARSFNEVMSPRLSQRHALAPPHVAQSTPSRAFGVSPVIWVHSNHPPNISAINGTAKKSRNAVNFDTPESSTSSLTPSDSINMSPARQYSAAAYNSLPRMNCPDSTTSSSVESQNFVQMDSMLLNGTRDRSTPPTRDTPPRNSTASSSSGPLETNGLSARHHQCDNNGQLQPKCFGKPDTSEQRRRRMYRVALNVFNKRPDRGIQLLVDWRFLDNHPAAIAKFLLTRRGLGKKMIGEFLGTLRSDFHSAILNSVLNDIEMHDQEIDEALRTMITYFQLPSEAQKIDYIMQAFARRYYACNVHRLAAGITHDSIYVLSFAIIMLNTDLHSPSIKSSQRMSAEQFVKNTWGAFDTHAFDRQVLLGIYERIRESEICPGNDHVTQVVKVEQTITGRDKPRLAEQHRRLICYCRVNEILAPTKRQSPNAHQREIFLFNDLILITKAAPNRRKDTAQYTLRQWSPLLGLRIDELEGGELFPYAMRIVFPGGSNVLTLNAKNANDRVRFIADVQESVQECEEMERLRIAFELNRQAEVRKDNGRALSATSVEPAANGHHTMPGADNPPSSMRKSPTGRL